MYFAGPWNSDTLYDPAAVHDIRNSQGRIFRERLSQLACAVATLGVASRRVPSHGSLGHRSITRRRLCLGAGSCPSPRLGMFLLKNLAFKGGQFGAVAEEGRDQGALGSNGSVLFHSQQGHQAVGNQEQQDENREQGMLAFGFRCG